MPAMKKYLTLLLAGFATWTAQAQCAFNNTFLMDATPPACPGTMTIGCMTPGEYVTVNVTTGNTYTFTTCGGTLFTDTELTLYNGVGSTVLAYNDDDCGAQSTINWVATLTGTVNLLLDEFPCTSSGSCVDVEVTCTPPVQSGNGCNTDITICTPGVAGPFGFNTPGPPVSTCLDFFGPDYGYIVLYITSSGPLELLIDGDASTGFLDVAIFDIPSGQDPCVAIQNTGNEIGCNYADFSNGCNQFGTSFPCTSSVPSPNVTAGDVVMIVVENWSGSSSTFTMDLANPPAAQTGPPDPTINPVGVLCTTDPAFQMTAVNMGGDWSGPGISTTGTFNPATAGVGTHTINYVIGQPPCQSSSSINVQVIDCSAPCSITNLTANVGACVVGPNTYSTTGQVTFVNAPASGQLIVEDCNGVQQVFNAPFLSPTNYTLSGQNANGAACDITAYFSTTPACTQTIAYTAPVCTCNIDNFVANLGACLPDNTFQVTGTVQYSSPPAGGTLVIQVNNSGTDYTTTINPPFTSPDNYTITGIPSNGAPITITVFFSANPACTSVINSTAPPSCACAVDVGTFSATITGSSTNNYVLCYGDQIDINSDLNFTPPAEQFAPPGPAYDPGVSWLIYSCPPTVALVPNLVTNIPDDPCFLGLYSDLNLSDLNDLGMINSFPPGTFTNNTIYYVPITMYSMSSGTYSYVNTSLPCYELGAPFAVQYLPQFNSAIVQDCNNGTATITVSGGLPQLNGTNFTASNLLPVTASFSSTTAPNNGTFVINGLTGGQTYSFTVNDGNGCPYTINGGPFPPSQNPGFNYANTTLCVSAAPINPVVTGVAGGTFTSSPAGLTLNAATGQITPATSSAGVYSVTYTTPGPCPDDSTITFTIITTPAVSAGPDQSICAGDPVTLTGTGAGIGGIYAWDNGVTDGVSFNPAATLTYTVTGTAVGGCQGTDQVTVTVSPIPLVNAGPDQTICPGDPVTLTGSGAGLGGVYAWDNGVSDGVAFNPAATTTYTVTGTNTALCAATDQVIVTVNPLDDPSFNYPLGLTYCQTAADPTPVVTGMTGGAFSFTVTSGGPVLSLNTATGQIDLSASDIGTYAITYNTASAPGSLCPQTATLNLTITDNPLADFTFGTYCTNGIDPSPVFLPGASGGIFSAVPAGLSITPPTGLVDLSASAPGTYTVTNTVNIAGCALATYNDDIVINGLPAGTISGTATICPGAALPDVTINLTAGAPNWNLTYNYNGTPVVVNVAASPYIISGAAVGTYSLVTVTDANGCTNTLAGNATISNYPVPVMNALNDQEICEGTNLIVQTFGSNLAGSTFDWTNTTGTDVGFGLSGTGNIPIFLATNGSGTDISVTVSVTPTSSNGCVGAPEDFVITIHANPIVSFTADTLNGCSPFVVNFTNTSSVPGQNCIWNFGNGLGVVGCGTVTTTFNSGTYDVTLDVTTADGCFGTATVTDYIHVYDTPVAEFSYSPQILDIGDTEVNFTNHSDFADTYEWDFGDTTVHVFQVNPTHTYPAVPNVYLASLIASNNNGMCADTAYQLITIQDIIIFYVPNVFTPDHDEFNEGFHPVFTSGFDPFDYHLTIFNRWGEIVFESYDATKGWDGTYSDQGLVQDGVYIWQIEFKETMSDKRHTHRGHVTVLK